MRLKTLSLLFIWILALATYSNGFGQPTSQYNPATDSNASGFGSHIKWVDQNQGNINEINLIGGYSFGSTRGFWGKIPGAELQVFSVRYNRKLLHINNKHVLEYVTELNFPIAYTLNSTRFDYGTGDFLGFGGTPLGFQFNWRRQKTVQPFVKSSTGFMYFKERFPDERGTKFNFTLELGGGIEFVVTENLSLSAGYKYHHMSNFFFGEINPGVDSNIFYTGITIF